MKPNPASPEYAQLMQVKGHITMMDPEMQRQTAEAAEEMRAIIRRGGPGLMALALVGAEISAAVFEENPAIIKGDNNGDPA